MDIWNLSNVNRRVTINQILTASHVLEISNMNHSSENVHEKIIILVSLLSSILSVHIMKMFLLKYMRAQAI